MKEINKTFLEHEIMNSYLSYAMSVIVGRALPDVRDGLKPVHRRIIFAMKELNNTFNKQYKKSARIVGDVIGKYHPHGEIAVYDSIVRMSQNFLQRYPLIDGQGNFGSIDGDPPAAMRYTEIRLEKITDYLIKDLDFFTVDYINNYDNTHKYPSVLPNMFPNLLINGSYGIAVGMATNIPPHNISEVIDACLATIDNKNITIEELMMFIKGPDFPTCGYIEGCEGIIKAYKTGKGKINIKAKIFTESQNNKDYIIISELPYQVNKLKLIEKIKFLIKEKKISNIKTIRDESDKDGLRISIEIIKGNDTKIILNNLYLLTKIKNTFNINMVALVNNLPKTLNLKGIINYFLDHRQEIIYRRSNYILTKIKDKFHIVEGLYFILNNIKKIIEIITNSKNTKEIKNIISNENLKINNLKINNYGFLYLNTLKKYKFSKKQIYSTLELKLNKLVKLEKNKLLNTYITLLKDLYFYTSIINSNLLILKIIKDEFLLIKNKFSDKRRTCITENEKKIETTDLINKEDIIIILTKEGYIKFKLIKELTTQKRGGKGKIGIQLNKNDKTKILTISNTHSTILCISNLGKLYFINIYDIQQSIKMTTGIPILNILNLEKNETINLIISTENIKKYMYLIIVTKKGIIKKINTENIKKTGTKIISLINDEICDIKLIQNDSMIMLFSNNGKAIKFSLKEIRCTSKKSYGITGMKLKTNEKIISLICCDTHEEIILSTENGFGKRTKISDYPLRHRGGKGVMCSLLNEKIGKLKIAEVVNKQDDLLLITENGMISRIKALDVSCTSRYAKGVFLIKLNKNEKLTNIKIIKGDII
ncbi:MAG TPA: DNA gyrase subunit A [Candidatus Azoamicus sp.]